MAANTQLGQRPVIKVKVKDNNSLQATVPVTLKNTVYELKHLNQLADVTVNATANGDILTFSNTVNEWINSSLTFVGTANEVEVTKTNFHDYQAGLPNNVVIANSLLVGTTFSTNSSQTYIANGNFDNVYIANGTILNGTLTLQDIIPDANNAYTIGTANLRFRSLYLSGNTLYMGNVVFEDTATSLALNNANGQPISVAMGNTLVNGILNVTSTFTAAAINANTITISQTSNLIGNVAVGGILSVNGQTEITGNLSVIGTINRNPNINIILTGDVAGTGNATLSDLTSVTISINTTSQGNSVELGVDTTGAYVAALSNGTGVFISNTTSGESEVPVIAIGQDVRTNSSVTFASANITGDATVNGQFTVANTISAGNTSITGFINVSSTANVGGAITARGDVTVNGALTVANAAALGNTTITGFADVTGAATVNGALTVNNTASVGNTTVTGFINVSSTANIGGVLTARGNVVVNGALTVANTAALGNTTITGFANVTGTLQTSNVQVTDTIAGNNMTLSGNLTVSGTTTYINTTNLNVGDNIITLNADVTGTPTENAGIEINRGTSTNATLLWTESDDKWKINSVLNITSLSGGNPAIELDYIDGANTTRWFAYSGAGFAGFGTDDTSPMIFYNAASEKFRINASGVAVTGVLVAGNTTITGFVNTTASVNSALLSVGTNFIANTTGAYHTGTVNAASFTTTIFTANVTGAYVGANVAVTASGWSVGNSTTNVIANSSMVVFASNPGQGIGFYGAGNTYSVTMKPQNDASGGRLDSISDFNMYFAMNAGTNRGFVFRAGNTTSIPVAQIDGIGAFYTLGTHFIGNSTVNSTITATALSINTVSANVGNFATSANVGANVNISTSQLSIGNSTANATANSILVRVANATASANLTPIGLATGITTVNATIVAVGANVYANATSIYVGNATTQSVLTNNGIVVGQSTTGQVTLGGDPSGAIEIGQIGRSTSGSPYIDFHSSANSPDHDVRIIATGGNTTSGSGNLQIQANVVNLPNTVITGTVSGVTTLAAGNTTITGFVNTTASVNSAILSVGTSFVANTTGAYHTGTVNATSVTVGTAVIANSTGVTTTGFVNAAGAVNAASHTVGTALIANSTGVYHTGTVNAASVTVGTAVIANSTGVTTTGFANIGGSIVGRLGGADANVAGGVGLDINSSVIRVGDGVNNLAMTNGTGIKIHDSGNSHKSIGQIGNTFYISDTSADGNSLFPATRTDLIVANTSAISLNTNTSITGFVNVSSTANIGGAITARGNVTVNGQFVVANTISVGNTTVTGFINVSSTANIGGVLTARSDVVVNGALTVANTTSFGNTTITGFANVSGNLTANNIRALGSIQIDGDLTVSGNSIIINATDLAISDNIIYLNEPETDVITSASSNGSAFLYTSNNTLAAGLVVTITGINPSGYNVTANTITFANATHFAIANTTSPGAYVSGGVSVAAVSTNPDIGFVANYNDGVYRHAGFFRDASDGVFKVFDNFEIEPNGAFIDTSNNTFRIADFQSNNTLLGTANVATTARVGTGQANYLEFTGGATTVWPSLAVKGTDTNIGVAMTTKGTGSYTFGTNSNYTVQFAVAHTTSAVNYLQATGGATGATPYLITTGTDTDISMVMATKGAGGFSVWSNGGTAQQFRVSHTASAVNYLQMTGGTTGNRPWFYAQGSDANVGIRMSTKGTGDFIFQTGGGSEVTQLAVTHTASAVNYVQVTGAATGGNPTISMQGSDSNIGAVIASKGVASVVLVTNSARQFDVYGPSSAVNYIRASGSVTGSGVQLVVNGSDANIDFILAAKGTGSVISNNNFTVTQTSNTTLKVWANTATTPVADLELQRGQTATWGGDAFTDYRIRASGGNFVLQSQNNATSVLDLLTVDEASNTIRLAPAGVEQFRVLQTASAVNYIQVTGATTGSQPLLSVQGSDTNISFSVTSKGSGGINFWTNNSANRQLSVSHTASAVNFLQVTGAATGSSPVISAQGSDTNVGVQLIGKGTGQVQGINSTNSIVASIGQSGYGAFSAQGTTAAYYFGFVGGSEVGRLTFTSSNNITFGTSSAATDQFRVSHTASAVNYLEVTGAATGSGPTLRAIGSDANVALNISAKAAANVNINSNTNFAANTLTFTGSAGSNTSIALRVLSDGVLSFEGGAGQLFSIANSLTGQIFAVNDISGIPSVDVYSNGQVNIARFGGNVSIGTSTSTITVNGSVTFGNTLTLANNLSVTGFVNATAGVNTSVLSVGTSFIANSSGVTTTGFANVGTSVSVGANVIANTTALFIGNSTVNTVITQTTASFDANSTTVALLIAANGNIGINNNAPTSQLQVTALGGASMGNTIARFGTSAAADRIRIVDENGTGNIPPLVSSPGAAWGIGLVSDHSVTAPIIFYTGTANTTNERMRLNNTGLGIGNNNPNARLHVTGTANISGNVALGQDLTVAGNLTVSGTTTYINTTNLDIGDNIITLNADLTGATAPTENAGFVINRGSSANVSFLWDESGDRFLMDVGNDANSAFRIQSNTFVHGVDIVAGGFLNYWGNTSVASAFATFSVASGVNKFRTNGRDYFIANTASDLVIFAANGNIGLGNLAPSGAKVVIESSVNNNEPTLLIRNPNTSSSAIGSISIRGDTAGAQLDIGVASNTYTGYGLIGANSTYILSKSVNGLGIFADNASSFLRFGAGGTSEHIRLVANGNLGIGNTAPSDKLSVNGTLNVTNSTANGVLLVAANGNIGVGTIAPTQPIHVIRNANSAAAEVRIENANTGSSAQARLNLVTSSAFSYALHALNDGATPSYSIGTGPGVTGGIIINSANAALTLQANSVTTLRIYANNNVAIGANTTPTDKLRVEGTLSHTGLNPSAGINIDQIYTATPSITLNTSWQSTGVTATNLANGTYIVQLLANDVAAGGTANNEYYSGIMSWYSADVNSTILDEIPLHRAGVNGSNNSIFLATQRTATANTSDLILMISSAANNSSASTYTLKFRRMI